MSKNYKTSMVAFFIIALYFICNARTVYSAELTEKQLWAIALTGIITEINSGSHTTLRMSLGDSDFHKRKILELLNRDWDISDRNDLLGTLKLMEENGHAPEFDLIKKIIRENDNNLDKIKEKHKLNSIEYKRLLFISQHWESLKFVSIKSWDLGRNISLCRWGYEVGFLSETEAWNRMMNYAKMIQPLYRSWEEYGYTYTIGRMYWASGDSSRSATVNERTGAVFSSLIKGEVGQWHNLKWNINLK